MTTRHIALVAHDGMKNNLIKWVKQHSHLLTSQTLYATGSTGKLIADKLDISVNRLESGPLGGDQQIGAMIVERKIDMLIFFWDPLEAQPHDPDVRALLRISAVWNIPVACNTATADYLLSSTLFTSDYQPEIPNFEHYRNRTLG